MSRNDICDPRTTLVVDDHAIVLDALAHLLPHLDANAEVRAPGDAAEAVSILDSEPDVALVRFARRTNLE